MKAFGKESIFFSEHFHRPSVLDLNNFVTIYKARDDETFIHGPGLNIQPTRGVRVDNFSSMGLR